MVLFLLRSPACARAGTRAGTGAGGDAGVRVPVTPALPAFQLHSIRCSMAFRFTGSGSSSRGMEGVGDDGWRRRVRDRDVCCGGGSQSFQLCCTPASCVSRDGGADHQQVSGRSVSRLRGVGFLVLVLVVAIGIPFSPSAGAAAQTSGDVKWIDSAWGAGVYAGMCMHLVGV